MEELLELVKDSGAKLTIRYEKEYDTYLFKMKKYGARDHEAYRHVYPEDIDRAIDFVEEMVEDLKFAEEEDLSAVWG